MSSADVIAPVVADLRAGRVHRLIGGVDVWEAARFTVTFDAKTVDATAIYHSLVARDDPVFLYEDHPNIAPPFQCAEFCYVNEHGNVIVMKALAQDRRGHEKEMADSIASLEVARPVSQPEPWEPAEPIEWDRVRWIIDTMCWIGGRKGDGTSFPTGGPVHMWRFAVYETGQPADLHWVHLVPEYPLENWDMAHLVLLGSLNFLNCRNVELVEPERPRPERRRIARTGQRIYELSVFPVGRSSRSAGSGPGQGVPLSSVRGHFSHYGDCCPGMHDPRGLLFGKLTGRFWIPQHARGSAEHGEHESSYRLVPDDQREKERA